MVVNYKKFEVVEKQTVIDIKPNIFIFIVKFIAWSGEETVKVIETDTLDGYIDMHDYSDYRILKIFCYTLNSELEGYDFNPNYCGKRFN